MGCINIIILGGVFNFLFFGFFENSIFIFFRLEKLEELLMLIVLYNFPDFFANSCLFTSNASFGHHKSHYFVLKPSIIDHFVDFFWSFLSWNFHSCLDMTLTPRWLLFWYVMIVNLLFITNHHISARQTLLLSWKTHLELWNFVLFFFTLIWFVSLWWYSLTLFYIDINIDFEYSFYLYYNTWARRLSSIHTFNVMIWKMRKFALFLS